MHKIPIPGHESLILAHSPVIKKSSPLKTATDHRSLIPDFPEAIAVFKENLHPLKPPPVTDH